MTLDAIDSRGHAREHDVSDASRDSARPSGVVPKVRNGAGAGRSTPAGFENRVRLPDASADRPIRAGKLSNLRDDAGTARPERRRGEVAGAVRHDAALLDKHRTDR